MTRANIYAEHTSLLILEIGSDAYPGGDIWEVLKGLDARACTFDEFVDAMVEYALPYEVERLGKDWFEKNPHPRLDGLTEKPDSNGVGNWSYEYLWCPVLSPTSKESSLENPYCDWGKWRGRILVRRPDWSFRERVKVDGRNNSYAQIPGPWMTMEELEQKEGSERLAAAP